MARDFDGSTTSIDVPSISGSAPTAYTVGCWLNTDTVAAGNRTMWSLGDQTNGWQILLRLQSSHLYMYHRTGAAAWDAIFQNSAVSAGSWYQVCATWNGTTVRLWKNGGDVANSAESTTYATFDDRNGIGRNRPDNVEFFDGKIAEAFVAASAWDAGQIGALASGISPIAVNPADLIRYYPLIGRQSPEPDLINAQGGTLNNAPANAAHPPVIYPYPMVVSTPGSGAAGGTIPPLAMSYYRRRRVA